MLVIKTEQCRLSEVAKDIDVKYTSIKFHADINMFYDMHFNSTRWAGVSLIFSAAQHIIQLPENYCEIITDGKINAGDITIIGEQANLEHIFKLSAKGGKGQNGSDGVDGADGIDGAEYFYNALIIGSNWYKNQSWFGRAELYSTRYPKKTKFKAIATWNTNVYSVCCGVLGTKGHPGGLPGLAGKGGKGGKITIGANSYFDLDGQNGIDGKPGNPGKDGGDYFEIYLAKPIYLQQNEPIVITDRIKNRNYKYCFIGAADYNLALPELEENSLVNISRPLIFSSQTAVEYVMSSLCNNILGDYAVKITNAFAVLCAHHKFSKNSYMQCVQEINRRFAMALQFKCLECEATVGLADSIESLFRLFLYNYKFNLVSNIINLQQMIALKDFLKTSLDSIIDEILFNEAVNNTGELNINRKVTKEVMHIHMQVNDYLRQYFYKMLTPSVLQLKLR